MSVRADAIDRLTPTLRPPERAVGYQRWTHLSFLHWRVPAESLTSVLPEGLSIDTFDGSAWVGLVPFDMSRVRPWWFCPVPGLSRFHETNVRTYVHHQGRNPGVWFFSLEASNSIAVQIARERWNLNYQRATMAVQRAGDEIHYRSRRLWPGLAGVGCDIRIQVGKPLLEMRGEFPPGQARPGTLEHFLAERYLLYTQDARGRLLRGQVHHRPYPLKEAIVGPFQDSLVRAAGIRVSGPPEHALFSEGVDVSIYPLKPVESAARA